MQRTDWRWWLTAATAALWLAIGIDGFGKGERDFVTWAAALSGLFGLAAIALDRRSAGRG